MRQLEISPVASQTLSIVLAQQNCRVNLYQKTTGLYFDLFVDGAPITTCVIGRNGALLLNRGGSNFIGNFMFVDTMGELDPQWDGLGIRFMLLYVEASDV